MALARGRDSLRRPPRAASSPVAARLPAPADRRCLALLRIDARSERMEPQGRAPALYRGRPDKALEHVLEAPSVPIERRFVKERDTDDQREPEGERPRG